MPMVSSCPTETESLRRAEAAFRREHPLYADTAALDELRLTDFVRLEYGRHVYLDYTGGGLYADSQLVEHMQLLRENDGGYLVADLDVRELTYRKVLAA